MSSIYFKLELNVNFLKLLFNSVKISAHFYDSTTVDIFMYVFRRILLSTTKFGGDSKNRGKAQSNEAEFLTVNLIYNLISPRQHVLTNVRGCFGNIKQIVHQNHIPDSNKMRWFYISYVNITE